MAQQLTERGLNFIIREEGLVPYAYEDPDHGPNGNLKGWATFGVGHLIQPKHRGVTLADKIRYGTPSRPHPRQARRVFKRDIRKFEQVVSDTIGRTMWEHRFAACVSLAFNIGAMGFATSTVARRIKARESAGQIEAAWLMWDNPPILRPRRKRELALFFRALWR